MKRLLPILLAVLFTQSAADAVPNGLAGGLYTKRRECPAPDSATALVRADRPFLFAIIENSTPADLSLGRLENPATN